MNVLSPEFRVSPRVLELNQLFNDLEAPYGRSEVLLFNRAYQRTYPLLNRDERFYAEKLVDALLSNLVDEALASSVYGVV
jgi:hypothetical protein